MTTLHLLENPGLPKSIIRKYGISKRAWQAYRSGRSRPRRRGRRRRANLALPARYTAPGVAKHRPVYYGSRSARGVPSPYARLNRGRRRVRRRNPVFTGQAREAVVPTIAYGVANVLQMNALTNVVMTLLMMVVPGGITRPWVEWAVRTALKGGFGFVTPALFERFQVLSRGDRNRAIAAAYVYLAVAQTLKALRIGTKNIALTAKVADVLEGEDVLAYQYQDPLRLDNAVDRLGYQYQDPVLGSNGYRYGYGDQGAVYRFN